MKRYDAVLFDLLTALLDSWSLWNRIAGNEAAGRAWRAEYLKLTYGCGAYRSYETLVEEAAMRMEVPFNVVVTAERMLFVCGSAFDLFGTAQVGMTALWHNRVGLKKPDDAPSPQRESRTLEPMVSEHLACAS